MMAYKSKIKLAIINSVNASLSYSAALLEPSFIIKRLDIEIFFFSTMYEGWLEVRKISFS